MAEPVGRHSEIMTQCLRHVTTSPLDADLQGDILDTPSTASLVVIAFRFLELRSKEGILSE